MSGPNDSGPGDTPASDLKTPLWDGASPRTLSPRFRLQLHLEPLRLDWRPAGGAPALRDRPAFLNLEDPFAAVLDAERYIVGGALLFDMRATNLDLIDKAFLVAPIAPPSLLPSFAQMKEWEDDAFYRRLGRSAPLFGAPAPRPLLTPPIIAAPPPSPFYRLPDPSAMPMDAVAPKAGSVGDVLKAAKGLKVVQDLENRLNDEASRQIRLFKADWDKSPWLDRSLEITMAAPLAASVVGTIIGADDARHFAFNLLKGREIPLPPVPGLSFQIDNFGKADSFLLGTKPDAQHPQAVQFGLKFDLLKAIPALRKTL
jgi:hypothetical protein